MEQSPQHAQLSDRNSDADKLQLISELFGQRIADRIAPATQPPANGRADPQPAERRQWQTNRLIEHLRRNTGPVTGETQQVAAPVATTGPRLQHTTALERSGEILSQSKSLAHEHPAILAKLLADSDQQVRIAVLRRLPGWLARDVMRRFRRGADAP